MKLALEREDLKPKPDKIDNSLRSSFRSSSASYLTYYGTTASSTSSYIAKWGIEWINGRAYLAEVKE